MKAKFGCILFSKEGGRGILAGFPLYLPVEKPIEKEQISMAEVIRMPRMSDTMTEGVIVQWLKKVGDALKIGDVMAEVETDKATMDLESPAEGSLLHIGIEAGQAVPIDGIIAVIGKPGEDFQALLQGGGGAAPAPVAEKK